jgi:hypothetical protein
MSIRPAKYPIFEIFLGVLTLFSVISVISVPTAEISMLESASISISNWLRYLSSILLTTFLPGYFILRILDRKHTIDSSLALVLGCLLSIFITFLAGFLVMLSGNLIDSLGLPIMATVNIFLSGAYYLANWKRLRKHWPKANSAVSVSEIGIIFSLLAVIAVGSVAVMICNVPLTPGDMRRHYGTALDFSNGFSTYGGQMITYSGGYLFPIYLFVLFTLSGIPPALAEQGLYALTFLPLLGFYSVVKVWFIEDPNKKMSSVATALSLLLGFGGLYALYLRFVSPVYVTNELLDIVTSKTYDVGLRILYLPDIVAPIWIIGLPVLFALLCFIKKEYSNLVKGVFLPIMVVLGYLAHAPEIFIFSLIFFIYVLLIKRRPEHKIGLYILAGLGAVFLVDFIAPAKVYILFDAGTSISFLFIDTLLLAILASFIELIGSRYSFNMLTKFGEFLSEKLESSWRYLRWILLYVYAFLIVVWFVLESNLDFWLSGGYNYTPFFIFPLRFGVVGLLAVLSLFFYFKKIISNRSLLLVLLLMLTGFVSEQVSNYYSIYSAYRFGTITFLGACVIAAFGIVTIAANLKKAIPIITLRRVIICLSLGFLVISGMLSTSLFYVNATYYSMSNRISQDTIVALDYIRQNTPANASVLTFTAESANELRTFAGINAVQDAQRWSQLLLSASNPYLITYILGSSNVKYIYASQRDYALLNSSRLGYFVQYFPVVVRNRNATVYAVPPITAPSAQATFTMLHFSPSLSTVESPSWTDDSFASGWYPYKKSGEIKDRALDVNEGIMVVSVTSNQTGNVWASWARSNISLSTTLYSILSFRYHVENNSTWFTLQLVNSTNQIFFYKGHLSAPAFDTKSFELPSNQTITRIEIIVETTSEAKLETTATGYLDFVRFSAPITKFEDDNFVEGWEFYQQYGNISNSNAYSNGDIFEIRTVSNQTGNVWTSYSVPIKLQTKNSVLSFRYKVENDYTWFTIVLHNESTRFFFYKGQLTDKTFTTKSYLLPDNQTITRIEILVETRRNAPPKTSAIAQIDRIEISPQSYSKNDVLPSLFVSLLRSNYETLYIDDAVWKNIDTYLNHSNYALLSSDPTSALEPLLRWVSAGNTLIVFNTLGNGHFSNILGISNSSTLLTIGKFNFGKVIYMNIFPLISDGRESEIFQNEFVTIFRELLHLPETSTKIDALPVYNSISGGIQIKGDVQIMTDTLILRGNADLKGVPFQLGNFTEAKFYGSMDLKIRNSTLMVFPSESYILIKSESYPLESEVSFEKTSKATIVRDNADSYELTTPITLTFEAAHLSIYARLPSVNATGTVTFDQLDVHSSLYVPLAGIVQQKAEIHGNVQFSTLFVSNPTTVFSSFTAEGRILNLAITAANFPEVQWTQVLTSPYNLAFNLIFGVGLLSYILLKRRTRTFNKLSL